MMATDVRHTEEHQDISELSITELFKHGKYVIPIYQRNYAWGEPEVEQLIQDIMDVATQGQDSDYFIGSLIAYARKNNEFETIDGQQRHTTLSILLAVLKHEFDQDLAGIGHINLGFKSRRKSDQTLRKLFEAPHRDGNEPEERSIRSAYEVATRFLQRPECDVDIFTEYLLNRVKILRVVVPVDTDLNHYFEIMNNRGEQLEKHEVLKARMMAMLPPDEQQVAFAKIWDACADMARYVQLGFDSKVRKNIFGNGWDEYHNNFDVLCEILGDDNQESDRILLADLIASPKLRSKEGEVYGAEDTGSFSPIINFSNFLLHVLRITTQDDVPLDDKRLLETFDLYLSRKGEEKLDPSDFIENLLTCRLLFDRYIIKRENEEDWSLTALTPYQKSFSYINSNKDAAINQKLIMIQSMFHVSFPALIYKHWLNAALNYLYLNCDEDKYKVYIDQNEFLDFLEGFSDDLLLGRFGTFEDGEPVDYYDLVYDEPELPEEFDLDNLALGTGVQNFIFNRLDYLLWKQLTAGDVFEGVDMTYILKRLSGFSFTFRTSVEHYYPQHPIGGSPLTESDELPNGVDSFGNLCLISRSNNSRLSNNLPAAKKDYYETAPTIESLKQVFMMSYPKWGPDRPDVIAEHEEMMVEVLCGGLYDN